MAQIERISAATLRHETKKQSSLEGIIILLHYCCGWFCSCPLEMLLAVNRSLLFVHSFIRCEWMAKMNVHGSSSSLPNFTSKSMPIVYPKVIKLNVTLNCVYSIIQAYKLVYLR